MLIIGLLFSFIVTSLEFYFKAKRRRLLDGKSMTIKERLAHDLHFALCTNCTSSRPTFFYEKESIDQDRSKDDTSTDVESKCNSTQKSPRDTVTSIKPGCLTNKPANHLPRQRAL